jgi:polar amino acid transport system substrate-binding protein
MNKLLAAAIAAPITLCLAQGAMADGSIDNIIAAGTLRCGVQLDFPPAGFRTAENEPEGYDVAYCKDMAAALGVTAEIVETPSAERIPALQSNRIDVLIASTSITPARALTVAFSQPYVSFVNVVLTRDDAGVASFDDLKGRTVGGVTGTTTEAVMQDALAGWSDTAGSYIGYGSEAESYLALSQGKIDGVVVGNATAAALLQSGQFPNLAVAGETPTPPDLAGIAVRKADQDLLQFVRTFVWYQVTSGRYAELYGTYFGEGAPPALATPMVEY